MARWRTLVLAAVGTLVLLTPGLASGLQGAACEGADEAVTKANLAASERAMLCLVNVYRAANGRPVLTQDPALFRAAGGHSAYMEETAQFAHQDIGNGTPQSRAAAAGYPFSVGENIAISSSPTTPAEIIAIFKASPAHSANMLDPTSTGGTRVLYVTAGMGLAVGSNHGVSATQMFGVGDNGGTATASELLTSPACEAAEADVSAAERSLAKAKGKLRRADTKAERTEARQRVRKAKRELGRAETREEKQCTLTY